MSALDAGWWIISIAGLGVAALGAAVCAGALLAWYESIGKGERR